MMGQRADKSVEVSLGEALLPPTPEQAMRAAFQLAKDLSLEMSEEEAVGIFMQVLTNLLPGRSISVRVIDPNDFRLTALLASGPLAVRLDEAALELKASSLRATGLQLPMHLSRVQGRVRIVDKYVPIFHGSHSGFSVPLVAARGLYGLLNVEYPSRPELASSDEPLAIPLANQLSVALRGVSLLHEARHYRDYLRQLLEVANVFIVIVDRDGKVAVVNHALQAYLGRNIAIGSDLAAIEPSEIPQPSLLGLLRRAQAGRPMAPVEVSLERATGELGTALFNVAMLGGPDGHVKGIIAIGQERDRIRSLERQIVQAEKLATLGQLAAGLVHELNNPLASISVYANYFVQLFSQRGVDGDLERAKKIADGAHRIERLSRELMSYARPSAEFEIAHLNEVIRQAVAFCELVVEKASAQLVLELDPDVPPVRMIPSQIQQVVINLITNACHALFGEQRVVRVRSSVSHRDVMFEVVDSGSGIDKQHHARLFEPFFTTKSEGRGSGLGLPICKHIVEAHGGTIHFESRLGEATRFVITLPLGG